MQRIGNTDKTADETFSSGEMQVWWIPQVPMRPFKVSVKTLREARLILNTLADYDKFQFDRKIKGDYCNTGGLRVWSNNLDGEDGCGWIDFYDADGRDIDEIPDDELDSAKWEENT